MRLTVGNGRIIFLADFPKIEGFWLLKVHSDQGLAQREGVLGRRRLLDQTQVEGRAFWKWQGWHLLLGGEKARESQFLAIHKLTIY